ncbi:long-chain specific acyl-CoA dehydrogenase, mitochondrial-like [Apostichopus japonicus]|uniref:long-chain specific acyl-CoA dehydrogenase, mitochondrial-like n=1 Tax=Stichopus japonicus TaxID=307972 RepID=UPI003AB78195
MAVNILKKSLSYPRFASNLSGVFPRYTSTQSRHGAEHSGKERRPETSQAGSMMDIGTRAIFSEEHDIYRRSLRKFVNEELVPHRERWEKEKKVDRETWKKAGAFGILGAATRVESGGFGADYKAGMVIQEEMNYANNPVGFSFGAHSEIVIPYIDYYGTKEQKEKFIPPMLSGEKIGALAMTEPSAGSDLQGISSHAKRDGKDWILNGSKVFITNGHMSDVSVVVAVTDLTAKSKAHGVSLFLVEAGMPGFQKGELLQKVGHQTTDTAELFFDDVRLPGESLLGGEEYLNKGFYCLMGQLPRERFGIAVCCTAHAEYMFELTREYLKNRKAFGKPLANLQTIQHRLADMKTDICVVRAFVDRGLQMADEGVLDPVYASMAKSKSSSLCYKIANECVQLHGGWGYMWDYQIARAFVDARLMPIFGGSNEIMNEIIARDIVSNK